MKLENGWLVDGRQCPSPNFNQRPGAVEVSLLVIHNISLPPGEFCTGNIHALFCNTLDCDAHPYFAHLRGLEVSAHFLVERDGAITQFVSCDDRAWHAGRSEFQGRAECNDYSVGIELEGTDHDAYTDAQYASLARLSRAVMRAYPGITRERITGHEHIAPGRKTDPGPAFDWHRYRGLLTESSLT